MSCTAAASGAFLTALGMVRDRSLSYTTEGLLSLHASLNMLITTKLPYPLFRNIPAWRNNEMVNKGWQLRMKRLVERLVTGSRRVPVHKLEKELHALGFVELGADQVAVAFEHRAMELYLEIELDDSRLIHSYFIVPFEEKEKKRRKYRW